VEIAVLVLLVTGLVIVAKLPQLEVKVTEIGNVAGNPFISTGTLTLLVP
jgi:hypothetical protein